MGGGGSKGEGLAVVGVRAAAAAAAAALACSSSSTTTTKWAQLLYICEWLPVCCGGDREVGRGRPPPCTAREG